MASTADHHKALGNKAFSAGQFDEAIEQFSLAIAADPTNHVLFSNRSAAYASLKRFDDARADAEQTVALNPKWVKGYSRLGAAHHGAGNLDAARESYRRGLELDPDNALLRKGLEDVNNALEAATNDPFAEHLNEGIWAKIAANPKLAPFLADQAYVAKIRAMIANPKSAMSNLQDQKVMTTLFTLLGLGVAHSEEEAAELAATAEAKPAAADARSRSRSPSPTRERAAPCSASPARPARPASPMAVDPHEEEIDVEEQERAKRREAMLAAKELGNAAYKKRDFATALAHYNEAWTLSDETEASILTNMAAVYFEQAQYDECIEQCEKAVEVGRSNRADFKLIARALARIGNAQVKKGDLEAAIKAYNKSLMEHRTADTLTRLRDTEKALETQRKQAYHDPALSDAARDRGNDLFKQQLYADAVKEYTEGIARNEADPRAYSNRAACYHKLGAIPEAIKDCDAAIARDDKFVKAYIRKAAIQHFTREHSKALETCELASKADVEGKHAGEIQAQMQKIYASMYGAGNGGEGDAQQSREERAKAAMRDPEIQAILSDPVMNQILQQMQEDPGAAREHMRNPAIADKIRKLVAAGILGTR
ncbi:Hsp90 cochaperone [Blastocladiella emersonii ATCC 22665]|nr:Hsp90 cochaperone [Blastocladiella emersonii ATCC 22665]